ncbi:MAG: hypothetical protein KAS47_05275 [Candidatus Heimdallarchaeota archaeon]|nr:hypothetical protein [Candidatus Heimdallarchaeota archaeon]
MTNVKYFHLGQFFSLRALLATFFGAGLVALTEFLLPWLGILQVETLWDWITPITITFTLAVIFVSCAIAKNVVASILIGAAAVLSFYNPYETVELGLATLLIIFIVTSFFAGFFATKEMTGRTGLLLIGIVFGLQGFIGSGVSMFLSFQGAQNDFHNNSVGISFGELMNNFPIYDTIVAAFSLIFMIVFIIISRKIVSKQIDGKKFEIIGQIIIFLSIIGALVFIVLSNVIFDNNTAVSIFGETNTQFLNEMFSKVPNGSFMAITFLNGLYILPIVGFGIGIGLAFIIYQRAEGTSGKMRFNFEGPFFILNLVPFLIICAYSYPVQSLAEAGYFYLESATWFPIFTEFTNLLLINLLVAYLIFKIITIIKLIAKR